MEAVIGLLLMLLRVSYGVETSCDGRQDGAQCYGALGGTVVLQLTDRTSRLSKYQWIKNNNTIILNGNKNKILSNLMENRSSFIFSDGTFRINNLSRTDGGEYTFRTFSLQGDALKPQTLQLTIQAPVSSVLLLPECLTQGEMRVSCSSAGGDGPQYSWTLDGRKLTDDQLLSGNTESNNITLKQNLSGTLVCSVKNEVSGLSAKQRIPICVFIDCDLPNGTHVSQWMPEANNILCVKPTTASPMNTEGKESSTIVSNKPSTNNTSSNQTLTPPSTDDEPWYISVQTYCDGRQDGAQCYGALGGTVVLQLMDSVSEISIYQWIKNAQVILRGRKNSIVLNLMEDRSSFTNNNGKFRINNLRRDDGGEYTLETFDSNGIALQSRTLQLTIQAPVSSVLLLPECLSQGEMRVSCSSAGGDSPQYSWTLDGQTLTDDQLLSGNRESNNITLRQDVKGQLVCSVRNHISRKSTCGFIFINCISSSTVDHSLLICGLRAAVVILILTGIAVYAACKKMKKKTVEGSAVPQEVEYENSGMVEMRSSASEQGVS